MSNQESRRIVPLAITVATAALAPLVVFFFLVFTTSDGSPRQEDLSQLSIAGSWLPVPGGQGAFTIGPKATMFVTDLPADGQWGRITFDLLLQKSIRPKLEIRFGADSTSPGPSGFVDLTPLVRGSGRNKVTVDFDDTVGLFDAERVQIAIVSPGGENIARLVNVKVDSFSFSQRWAQAWSRLFEYQPLTLRTINGLESSRIAGRGVTFLFWAGFILAMAVLLARRLVLRRRVSLLLHTAVTIGVLVVLADLRNSTDYARSAHEAVTLRAASANVFEYLNEFERRLEWFGPVVEFISENVAPGRSYFLEVRGDEKGSVKTTLTRLAYYAKPARRTHDEEDADFALLWKLPRARVDHFLLSDQWTRREDLPDKMFVFERNK